MRITLEIRTPDGEVRNEAVTPSPPAVESILRRLDGGRTTVLVLERQGRRLYVGGGPDQFIVLAQLGDDDFYDLVGDPSQRGRQAIVLGGQLTPTPRRHLVGQQDARWAALTFLRAGTVPLSARWERQGRHEPAY